MPASPIRSGRPSLRLLAVAALTFILGACTYTVPTDNDLLGYEGLGLQLRRFYENRAWEKNATCTLPQMIAIMDAQVISEDDEELVANVRYLYRSLGQDGRERRRGFGVGNCQDFANRRFTIQKISDTEARVLAMSGGQRGYAIGQQPR